MPTERSLADPEPLPKVSGPRYYTYKPDAERAVKTAAFAAASATDGTQLITGPGQGFGAGGNRHRSRSLLRQGRRAALGLRRRRQRQGEGRSVALRTGRRIRSRTGRLHPAGPGADDGKRCRTRRSRRNGYQCLRHDRSAGFGSRQPRPRADAVRAGAVGKGADIAQDMVRGRIDPNKISGYHDFKRKDCQACARPAFRQKA
jgi:hypothetical protein